MKVNINNKILFYAIVLILCVLWVIANFIYLEPFEGTKNNKFLCTISYFFSVMFTVLSIAGVNNTEIDKEKGQKESKLFSIF